MKRTNIHLTDAQREWLKTKAASLNTTPAALVRKAVDELKKTMNTKGQKT
jgi:hypothetical protein